MLKKPTNNSIIFAIVDVEPSSLCMSNQHEKFQDVEIKSNT